MSHWFDALARTHTRRAALKSAGVAAAGLMLGIKRLPAAQAESKEPCYLPCVQSALAAREDHQETCTKRYGHASYAEYIPIIGGIRFLIRDDRYAACRGDASIRYSQANGRCLYETECGDPKHYPAGAAPTPVHVNPPGCGTGGNYVACGDQPCCNLAYATCVACTNGPVCCRINGNCCG